MKQNYLQFQATVEPSSSGGSLVVAFACVLGIIFTVQYFRLCGERDAFNKFKRPDQPAATLWDAFCSELRVTTN
jgi:hypothetical protein